jgi:hypothetical protein
MVHNMLRIDQSNHVKKTRLVLPDGREVFVVSPLGDGNCATGSFALFLIDLIKRLKLPTLSAEKKVQFMKVVVANLNVLRDRLALYRGEENRTGDAAVAYSDLADDLENFIRFVSNHPDFDALFAYIIRFSNTQRRVAALHVALAPALRELGHQLHLQTMYDQTGSLEQEDYLLGQDGVYAGFEILSVLAHDFFGINLTAFDGSHGTQHASAQIKNAPEVHLLRNVQPDHWNFLLPVEQQDGLGTPDLLPENEDMRANSNPLLGSTIKLVAEEADKAKQFARDANTIKQCLPQTAAMVQQTTQNLFALHNQSTSTTASVYQKLFTDHSQHSTAILQSVREHLRASDRNLESYKLTTELEKDLLQGKGEDTQPLTQDEALARSLQSSEILSFLSKRLSG